MKRTAGFTIIEMLIVIAIIGILMALMLTNYAASLARGKRSAAQNQGRVVSLALTQYLAQNPVSSASGFNGLDCSKATTVNASGTTTAGYVNGSLGWAAATVPMTCKVSASGRAVTVTTTAADATFINGEVP